MINLAIKAADPRLPRIAHPLQDFVLRNPVSWKYTGSRLKLHGVLIYLKLPQGYDVAGSA